MRLSTVVRIFNLVVISLASPLSLSNAASLETATDSQLLQLEFYAQYAAAAYCNNKNSPGQLITCSNDSCPDVQANKAQTVATVDGHVTDIQGFVAIDPTRNLIVMTFRGTKSIENWITDFTFVQVPCSFATGCLVHSGFLTSWNEISSVIVSAVSAARLAHPSYSVIAVGHSLGGAVATLAAAYLRNQRQIPIDLYTYGSPRVGNEVLVEFIGGQAGSEYRVTHLDDPVPRLPPISLNFRHISPEFWLSTGNATTIRYTSSEVKICPGTANVECNAATFGLDKDAHGYYFGKVSACAPPSQQVFQLDMTDQELVNTLDALTVADVAYVNKIQG